MKKRILLLGLLAVVSQLFSTGCLCHHPVARWRANHPYAPLACGPCALEARRPLVYRYPVSELPAGPTVGPLAGAPPCHSCGSMTEMPVGFNGGPGDVVPLTNPPTIGYPMPISPGPMVVPPTGLHAPTPMPGPSGH